MDEEGTEAEFCEKVKAISSWPDVFVTNGFGCAHC